MKTSIPLSVALVAAKAERERRRRLALTKEVRRWCPYKPWPKQQLFLDLDCEEAFFGGAAGGGKSIVLLMDAVQNVHVPFYRAIILRKTLTRMKGGGAVLDIAKEWWLGQEGVRYNGSENIFTFPSGAQIKFQQCQTPDDRFLFQGTSYHYIGWDELTEFPGMSEGEQNPYLYGFRSLRRAKRVTEAGVALKVRTTSNPGNVGHMWVKRRFITPEAVEALNAGQDGVFWNHGRAFIPSKIKDNPALNEEEYRRSLSEMAPVSRERLMNGDWTIQEESLIREDWLRYFDMRGQILRPRNADGELIGQDVMVDERECRRFAICDPAGTSQERAKELKGKPRSWSVIEVWDYWAKTSFLFLRHVWRKRVGFDGLCAGIVETHKEWGCQTTYIENEKLGTAAADILRNEIQIQTVPTGGRDKVSRAAPLLNKLERGEVFLPKFDNEWRPDLEAEWLGWTGLEEETSDQVDAAAYAAVLGKGLAPVKVDAAIWHGLPSRNGGGMWAMKRG